MRASGAGAAGLRYAVETLLQLADAKGALPACEIDDAPDFRDRGIMLDVSRGRVPRRATLEALVDLCARMRLNVLMLYVEHTFAFRRHPEIGEGASPLDAETILALDAYAADRGVELVPCLQSLGHMERILSLPRYRKLAESDRRWSVSPSRPETYDLPRESSTTSSCRSSARGASTRTATSPSISAAGNRPDAHRRRARASSSRATSRPSSASRASTASS